MRIVYQDYLSQCYFSESYLFQLVSLYLSYFVPSYVSFTSASLHVLYATDYSFVGDDLFIFAIFFSSWIQMSD